MIEFVIKTIITWKYIQQPQPKVKKKIGILKLLKVILMFFWSFGIDGLPQQSSNHRINQDSAFYLK